MARWVIILLLVIAVVFWLGGTGVTLGRSDRKPSRDEAVKTVKEWLQGLESWLPKPDPLVEGDVIIDPHCGPFPIVQIASLGQCSVTIKEGKVRRGAHIVPVQGQMRLGFTPPGKKPPDDDDLRDPVKLQFGEDGGKLSFRCISTTGMCRVRLVE
jgi:hypothetical protein